MTVNPLNGDVFPHIVTSVFAHASREALIVLRSGCVAFREQADARLFRQIAIHGEANDPDQAIRSTTGERLPVLPLRLSDFDTWGQPSPSEMVASLAYLAPKMAHVRVLVDYGDPVPPYQFEKWEDHLAPIHAAIAATEAPLAVLHVGGTAGFGMRPTTPRTHTVAHTVTLPRPSEDPTTAQYLETFGNRVQTDPARLGEEHPSAPECQVMTLVWTLGNEQHTTLLSAGWFPDVPSAVLVLEPDMCDDDAWVGEEPPNVIAALAACPLASGTHLTIVGLESISPNHLGLEECATHDADERIAAIRKAYHEAVEAVGQTPLVRRNPIIDGHRQRIDQSAIISREQWHKEAGEFLLDEA